MGILRRRYIISLDDKEADTLERYADVLGMRPSSVIKTLIQQSMINLQDQITVLEHLSGAFKASVGASDTRARDGILEAMEGLRQEGEMFLRSVGGLSDTLGINKGNKGVRLDDNLADKEKPLIFQAVDNTKKLSNK